MRLAALTVLLASLSTVAQAQDAEADERARLHFRAGQSHYEAGRFDQAVTEFEASYAIRPHAALQHNIYLAHRDAGRNQQAAAALRRYLDEADDVRNRELLEARLAALEQDAAEPTASPTGTPSLAPGIALMAGAAVLGAVAAVTGARAASEEDRLAQRCPTRVDCDPADRAIEDRARSLGIATDVIWPLASVVGIVGLALTIRAAKRRSSTETSMACAPGGCAVSLRGSF